MSKRKGFTAPIAAPPVPAVAAPTPITIRLPRSGTLDPWSGLSRGKLCQLVLPNKANGFRPPVKSFSLVPRGASRGTRLIDFQSLMAFLRLQMDQQTNHLTSQQP